MSGSRLTAVEGLPSQSRSNTTASSSGQKLDFLATQEPQLSVLSRSAWEMAASSLGQFLAMVLDSVPENAS